MAISSDNAVKKNLLREYMRKQRLVQTSASREELSRKISACLIALHLPGPVAVYLAGPHEIDLSAYVVYAIAHGIRLVAPRWNGEAYDLAALTGLEPGVLRRGPMGILEPIEPVLFRSADVATWLVPGLAFTSNGCRLGYGGGWYDRLLAKSNPVSRRLGIAADFQIVDMLPCESHDCCLTGIVTERGVL